TVDKYTKEVQQLAVNMREETTFQNKLIRDSIYERVADPDKKFVVPEVKEAVPYFNFAPIRNAMISLKESAYGYNAIFDSLEQRADADILRQINKMVYKSERHLTSEEGLPGRPWFTHLIYAPGYYTGYGVKTLPGVREAIEERQYSRVEHEIDLLGKTLLDFSAFIDKLTKTAR